MGMICSRDQSMDSAAFQDNATVHGQSWPEVWEDSNKLLCQIVRAGFLVNLRKCYFLPAWVKVLGLDVGWYTCTLADKS